MEKEGLAQGRIPKWQDLLGQLQKITHPNCTATKRCCIFRSSSGCHLMHEHAACGSTVPLSAPKTQGREPCRWHEDMEDNPRWKRELAHSSPSPLSTTKPTLTSSMQRVPRSHTIHNSEFTFPSIEKVREKKQGILLFLREYPCSVVKIRQAKEEVARGLLERSRHEWEANRFWESYSSLLMKYENALV